MEKSKVMKKCQTESKKYKSQTRIKFGGVMEVNTNQNHCSTIHR